MSTQRQRNPAGGPGFGSAYENALGQLYGTRTARRPNRPAPGTRAQRPLPPYGREVMDELAAGRQRPSVRLYACNGAWALARQHHRTFGKGSTLLLPPGANPLAFRWPPVGLVGNCTGLPGAALHALAEALVRDGVPLAFLLDDEHSERGLRVVAKRGAP